MNSIRVHFKLDQVDDYPPVAVESIWTQELPGDGGYVIDSIPFFINSATLGDRISVSEDEGRLWFDGVVETSDNSLLRVVLFDDALIDEVRLSLQRLGCAVETLAAKSLLAVNVPPESKLSSVIAYLESLSNRSLADYEEAILRQ
ncbi:DUF4265 domain-containing protein [uncultured Stenotrophomonas sp.]|uniref:DUF4265 domain-containing protein n=1 Tax=uncultured Stenotrophomonas sp. TaxID=165438 RepID=UPI0028F0AC14|nr:DUF4265 domain-containing protein [uncultured Stenotrophomonas sp.]